MAWTRPRCAYNGVGQRANTAIVYSACREFIRMGLLDPCFGTRHYYKLKSISER